MNKLRIARSTATALAVASIGLASLVMTPAAVNLADCPTGWYWDNERQNCLPPGLPKDPPQRMPYRRRHASQRHHLRQLGPSYSLLGVSDAPRNCRLIGCSGCGVRIHGIIKIPAPAPHAQMPRISGISLRLSRFIGIAELAAVVGLLAGIVVKPLAIVTAAVVVLLMAGALAYHLKARDNGAVLLPAAITGLAAIALLTLTIVA